MPVLFGLKSSLHFLSDRNADFGKRMTDEKRQYLRDHVCFTDRLETEAFEHRPS